MMSSHINSMLEHLRIKKPTNPVSAATAEAVAITGELTTSSGCSSHSANVNGNGNATAVPDAHDVTDNAGASVKRNSVSREMDTQCSADWKKRFSIPAVSMSVASVAAAPSGAGVHQPPPPDTSAAAAGNNGEQHPAVVAVAQSTRNRRDLSPGQAVCRPRKMSQDMRMLPRGSNANLGDDALELARIRRPVKVKSILTNYESYDMLHARATEPPVNQLACSRNVCMASIMNGGNFPYTSNELRKTDVLLEHAKNFLDQYYTSIRRPKSAAYESRLRQIEMDVEKSRTYHLTETELIYGAKLAWRNSARCIGRIQWSKLQVFDCRLVTTTSGMFEALCNHIKYATNKGNLRSAITIFPQRTDGLHDYRIWNAQLISYAGYRNADGSCVGDPSNAEFTEVCLKLGWKSKRTEWDILPLVLSANGHDPDYFDYPADLVLEVPLSHPTYEWFADLQLRWYALPAVSGMSFDCGGIQFTATAFSGWYMSTEIGCRNLCDTNRRNMLERVALKMDLETGSLSSLWKDKALLECNVAVLHSFQTNNVTIVDHHTASESFMKHHENESKLRNGCPADWIWIVPPMSASITPVYHQEMVMYNLKPSFDYQEAAHKTHMWKKDRDKSTTRKPRRKFNFKQIARAVKFTSKLFGRALSRRIKATVLYATETGKSEQYAKQLVELLGHAFNAQVYCMTDYDISSIEHEALLIVVASTFGNGDPPENGEEFAQGLHAMKLRENGDTHDAHISIAVSSKSFMKVNSRTSHKSEPSIGGGGGGELGEEVTGNGDFDLADKRAGTLRGSTTETHTDETFGPLSNVRFAVFGLGSSAYPNFCAYAKYVDSALGELGGERLTSVALGDEMCGQEHAFRKWAPEVFRVACETFCLDTDDTVSGASLALQSDAQTVDTVRLVTLAERKPLHQQLDEYYNKRTLVGRLKRASTNLHSDAGSTERSTILVEIQADEVNYQPGDHVGIFPANNAQLVTGILEHLTGVEDADACTQVQVLKETHSTNGTTKSWEPHERLPNCTLRTLLARFLDITTTPSRQLLTVLAGCCDGDDDEKRMLVLANDTSAYEDWKHTRQPHLLEVLEEFATCRPPAALLLVNLSPLQPRFYSISSSLHRTPGEVHLTVAVVKYQTLDSRGGWHYGVCSNYLERLQQGDEVYMFLRSASSFHLPDDPSKPVMLIGPGTGIAPFRSFWQHWRKQREDNPEAAIPRALLFFGCRTTALDLYADEKKQLLQAGILDKVYLALSRDATIPKTYVQDVLARVADSVYDHIKKDEGHVYVCGDVTMAEHVYHTLRQIIAKKESKSDAEVEKFLLTMRDQNRYHEDIFGITLRTAEIHSKSRATARSRMASQSQTLSDKTTTRMNN